MTTDLTRKQLLRLGGAIGASGAAAASIGTRAAAAPAARAAEPGPTPNIILITADDLGWADLGCYGSTFHETPVLDALAERGVRFTDAYAAAPVCSPTRASLLTGKTPASVGVTQQIGGFGYGRLRDVPYLTQLPWTEQSIARTLRAGGYHTWHVGKWHLGGSANFFPAKHGFEINVGGNGNGLPPGGFFSPYGLQPQLSDGPAGEYLTDRLTTEAIKLINGSDGRPFFLNLCHYSPHVPVEAPADLVEKYRRKAADLGLDPEPFVEGENFPIWHQRNQKVVRRTLQSDPVYAAMLESLDTNIGRLLDAVEAAGRLQDTLVVFTSDNGGLATAEGSPTCNAPLAEGKGFLYEGGIRVPLVAAWPGVIAAGGVVDEPVQSIDLYPTFAAAADLEVPRRQQVEGESLLGLVGERPSGSGRGPLFWHYPHYSNQGGTPAAAVRDGDLKLIRFYEDDHVELYDLSRDLGERTDLAGSPRYRSDRIRLQRTLDRWLRSVGAIVPEPNPFPEAFADLPGNLEYGG